MMAPCNLIKYGNFCECLCDSLLYDYLVLSVKNNEVQKRRFKQSKLMLQQYIDICHSFEAMSM